MLTNLKNKSSSLNTMLTLVHLTSGDCDRCLYPMHIGKSVDRNMCVRILLVSHHRLEAEAILMPQLQEGSSCTASRCTAGSKQRSKTALVLQAGSALLHLPRGNPVSAPCNSHQCRRKP
jgi:hypothetical protein